MLTIFQLTAFEGRQINVDYNMYLIMSNVFCFIKTKIAPLLPPPLLSWTRSSHSGEAEAGKSELALARKVDGLVSELFSCMVKCSIVLNALRPISIDRNRIK